MILAGDVGGTKANLALFDVQGGKLRRVAQRRFESKNYAQFDDIVTEFVRQFLPGTEARKLSAAAFGVAGPVVEHQVKATNLPWIVDAVTLARTLLVERVVLLNDLEATAHSLELLRPDEICVLNEGVRVREANRALIAAGTGLGEAILFWDGSRYVVSATEGGHCDFVARTEQEIELLRFLKKRQEEVDLEAVLSGRGFRVVHEFLDPKVRHASFDAPGADAAPEITRLGLERGCKVCVEALEVWTALYGAEAGNLALKALARGGVYVAGGIAVKVLPKLQDGTFVREFRKKAKFGAFLSQIPITVVLNEEAPLLGAAGQALARLGG